MPDVNTVTIGAKMNNGNRLNTGRVEFMYGIVLATVEQRRRSNDTGSKGIGNSTTLNIHKTKNACDDSQAFFILSRKTRMIM